MEWTSRKRGNPRPNGRRIKELIVLLTQQFETATPEHLAAAREIVLKMQFLQKLHQDAEALEAELEDAL